MRDFKRECPSFSGRGASQPHIAPLQKQERPASVREAEHLQALSADALLSAVLFRKPLHQSAATLGGSFASADRFEAKSPPLAALVIECNWIRASMGRMRTGRITVWNTRIAAHRTTTHFFRYPHPPRAGAVMVLIQYHATLPEGIATPQGHPYRPELRTQQNIIFVAFKCLIECRFKLLHI